MTSSARPANSRRRTGPCRPGPPSRPTAATWSAAPGTTARGARTPPTSCATRWCPGRPTGSPRLCPWTRSRCWMTGATGSSYFPPQVPRYTHPDYQRAYGHPLALTDAAEAIVLQAGDRYMELAGRWATTGEPFTREDDVRLFAMIQQAGQLAARAVPEVFAASSSSAA